MKNNCLQQIFYGIIRSPGNNLGKKMTIDSHFKSDRAEIEYLFEKRNQFNANNIPQTHWQKILEIINKLDSGIIRASSPTNDCWQTEPWIGKAILLYLKWQPGQYWHNSPGSHYDKIPLKYNQDNIDQLINNSTRNVPGAIVRFGAYIGKRCVLMPSFINIGAYVDDGTLIDTWATVGSCAQIGKNVHISGGTGIGGVLEPPGTQPTIIEDNCFIGARCEIAEGFRVGHGSVIAMGVMLGKSTKVYDRRTKTINTGSVPPGSVVVPGSLLSNDKTHSVNCAVIVKQVDERTKEKVGINAILERLTIPNKKRKQPTNLDKIKKLSRMLLAIKSQQLY